MGANQACLNLLACRPTKCERAKRRQAQSGSKSSLSHRSAPIVLRQSFALLTGDLKQASIPLSLHLSHRFAPIVLRQTLGLKPYAGEIVQAHFPLPSHLLVMTACVPLKFAETKQRNKVNAQAQRKNIGL